MKCGIKFCGGCNPRYERGEASRKIQKDCSEIDFSHANEDETDDHLLVIGGCPACCASYLQYAVEGDVIKMWDWSHIENVEKALSERQKAKGE